MAYIVIKRNKKREKYNIKKIEGAIRHAARDAKVGAAITKKVIHHVAHGMHKVYSRKKGVVSSSTLRKKVLSRLVRHSKAAVKAWQTYDRERKKK
ncbi:MAG: hypothetical protein HYS32_03990 [Candidatus Woesearchaeota archaeon]|nr:MAG: hypothetical protein HYS32_03990 [Candidatus Woesearchaeota archaeon]